MATVTLNIFTAAFPLITTNDLKYVVYAASDPGVEVASQTFSPVHPARTVSFPGLNRINYIWKLLEMNGITVVAERASFNVVPDNSEFRYKSPIEIQTDLTPGIVNGATSFVFDGTGGTYDWRGWNIFTERVGMDTMQRDVEYSWDSVTGTFTLLLSGDSFQPTEKFNFEFELLIQTSSGVPPAELFSGVMIVTGTTTLVAGDAGKKIIIKGASPYFVITLPDISVTPASVPFYFESGVGSHVCVRIATAGSDVIDWMKGSRTDLKIGPCEYLTLYKNTDGGAKWRVHDYEGNFLKVGRIITTDADIADEYNAVEMDGSSLSINNYARLYEDFVQQLPPSQVVNFGDWATGDNKYKFSYASGGLFKVPDRRNLFDRNSDGSVLPGVYSADKVGPISGATATINKGNSYTGPPNNNIFGNGAASPESKDIPIAISTGNTETVPKHYVTRKFILV